MADNNQNEKQSGSEGGNSGGSGGGGSGGGGRMPPDGNMRFSRSMVGWILMLAVAILLLVMFKTDKTPDQVTYSEFQSQLNQGSIRSIIVKDDGASFVLI